MPDPEFLADAFRLGRPARLSQVARGAMGAVWRLDLVDGRSFAAKELFWNPPDEQRVAAEVDLVERCRAAGVRSQRAVAAADGRYLARAPRGDRQWRLYEWIDGQTPDRQDPATAVWLVRQLGLIHRVNAADGVAEYQRDDSWYHRVVVTWERLAADAGRAGVPWAERLLDAVPRLIELTRLVNNTPIGPGVLSHRDLNGSNTVQDRSRRLWLVDWDNFGPLEPWRELGAILTEHVDDPVRLRRLTASYAESAPDSMPDIPRGPELFATGLAVWLNFLAGQARGVLEPGPDAEHHEWSATRVDGLIGPFPTLPELSRAARTVADAAARVSRSVTPPAGRP